MRNIFINNFRKTVLFVVCIHPVISWCDETETNLNTTVHYTNLIQQQIQVSGIVKDGTGNPIIGATVQVKNTTTGVITDFDGRYLVNVQNKDAVLVVSFIGFKSQEIKIGDRRNINVTLIEDRSYIKCWNRCSYKIT